MASSSTIDTSIPFPKPPSPEPPLSPSMPSTIAVDDVLVVQPSPDPPPPYRAPRRARGATVSSSR
ncbi:hypothetical protein M422DRAFT_32019 [Sphaerobolus stellatus SS14]|uniref:Uncharacterized protein n=1 Tax=Sphaerobolus stellatus (strain SS14) TaxID=990650 RepID=A0A0C9VRJ9_SPHS4|nr:hypothetical protein M422DRAFT_32019 [Sphaerobolus stellatus SS14]